MKYIKICVLLLSLIVTSCNAFLDIKPTDGLLDEIALVSNADFQATLNGAYAALISGVYGIGTTSTVSRSYYGSIFFQVTEYPTDNVKRAPSNSGVGQFLYNINFASDDRDIETMYHAPYIVLLRANTILSRLDQGTLTETEKNKFKGEALMLRALAHHDLVRLFAGRYKTTPDASHDGITLRTEVSLLNNPRNKVSEVYQQILKDIDEAIPLLSNTLNPVYFNKVSANALKARVNCYKEDWAAAEAAATAAITTGPALATGGTYTSMWTPTENNGEIIFKLKVILGQASMGTNFSNIGSGNHQFNATADIAESYEATDIRKGAFVSQTATGANGNWVVIKYPGTATNPGLADIKILRTSEMFLIRAEARFRQGNETTALADLNALKTARSVATVNLSGNNILTEIKNERRKEFAFEGHRWFDLNRYQDPLVRIDHNSDTQTLPANNFRFVLPIPQQEVFTNTSVKQNPGY